MHGLTKEITQITNKVPPKQSFEKRKNIFKIEITVPAFKCLLFKKLANFKQVTQNANDSMMNAKIWRDYLKDR